MVTIQSYTVYNYNEKNPSNSKEINVWKVVAKLYIVENPSFAR